MRSQLCSIFLSIFPIIAYSEVIPIQVSEEEDLTRLLLAIPPESDWNIIQEKTGFRIIVAEATGFDLPQTAESAMSNRIAEFSSEQNSDRLFIELNCDCVADGYFVDERFLVVDIANSTPKATSLTFQNTLNSLAQPWHQSLNTSNLSLPTTDHIPPREAQDDLDAAISTGLAQATYQGFLELRNPNESPATVEASPDILANIAIGVQSHLQTLTTGAITDFSPARLNCSTVAEALEAAWYYDLKFNQVRGELRRQIASSDDVTNSQAMLDYAMFLVANGFGHEAITILQDIDDPSDLVSALLFIAMVIDHTTPPPLIGLETCSENLAFWSFLQSTNHQESELDPRKLMMTFKLLPPMLQNRIVAKFGDALARAGYRDFQMELQDFSNTFLAALTTYQAEIHTQLDFTKPAAARDILRADLTSSDLDPSFETSLNPTSLPLGVLDTMRIERRDTPAEAALLDEVLARQVAEGNYFAVVQLLIDGENSIDQETLRTLSDQHLGQSIAQMNEPEVLAFAYRSVLPDMSLSLKSDVRARLDTMGVRSPPYFEDTTSTNSASAISAPTQTQPIASSSLPVLVRAPSETVPTFEESEELIEGSSAIRNAIETLLQNAN